MTSATRTANTHVCALSASVYSDVVTCIQSPRKGNSSGKHEHCQYDATGTNVQFDALCYSHSNNTNTTMQKTLCCQWLQRNWTLVEFVIAVSWQWLWQHGEASVETLHVREDAFPVGHFHTNHVVDLEQRNDLGTFPAVKKHALHYRAVDPRQAPITASKVKCSPKLPEHTILKFTGSMTTTPKSPNGANYNNNNNNNNIVY